MTNPPSGTRASDLLLRGWFSLVGHWRLVPRHEVDTRLHGQLKERERERGEEVRMTKVRPSSSHFPSLPPPPRPPVASSFLGLSFLNGDFSLRV